MIARRAVVIVTGLLVVLFSFAHAVMAQPEEAATAQELKVTVDKVVGKVDVRPSPEEKWEPAREQMVLKPGAQVSTMFLSRADLLLDTGEDKPDVVIVYALTLLTIDEHLRTADTIRTRLKLTIGSVRAGVMPTTLEADFRVATPTLTASVRGSEIKEITHFPDSGTDVYTGRLDPEHGMDCEDKKGRKQKLGSNEHTDDDLTHPVDSEKDEQNEAVPPEGSTDDEKDWSKMLPDPTDTNPGEEKDRDVHPEIDRTTEQELEPSELGEEERPEEPERDGGYRPSPHDGYYGDNFIVQKFPGFRSSALGYPFLLVPIVAPFLFRAFRRRRS